VRPMLRIEPGAGHFLAAERPTVVHRPRWTIPPERAHRLQWLIPGSTLQLIEGAGHLVQLDAPEALTAAIRRALHSPGRES
jgi:hypothetical protein